MQEQTALVTLATALVSVAIGQDRIREITVKTYREDRHSFECDFLVVKIVKKEEEYRGQVPYCKTNGNYVSYGLGNNFPIRGEGLFGCGDFTLPSRCRVDAVVGTKGCSRVRSVTIFMESRRDTRYCVAGGSGRKQRGEHVFRCRLREWRKR